MKRQILKSFKTLCMGAMSLLAASSLVVSCYDDSELWDEVDKLQSSIETLNANLTNLTSRVDGLYTLQFQVTSDNKLQYSFDGGTTWTDTGVVLSDGCACPEVSLVDNGDSVTIKVGDSEFTIVKPQEIVFELRAGKLYFESEGTLTVNIKSSGIEDISVMSAPKGWFADINSDGQVEITAPDYALTEPDYDADWNEIPAECAASGYVKVHACGAEGQCMVGKLPVEVVSQALVVKAYSGNAYLTLAGEASYWSPTFFYGACAKEDLEAETSALIKGLNDGDWAVYDDYLQNYGETEVTVSVDELLGEEPKVGEEYVVWALLESNDTYSAEDLVLAYYSPIKVNITEVEAEKTAYNVTINIDVQGAESYVAVAMPAIYCEDPEYNKEQMAMAMAQGQYYGKLYSESYTGSALDVAAGTQYSMTGLYSPASEVYVFVLPLDGRSVEDYTSADVHYSVFTTAGLTAGGAVDLTATQVTEYMGEVYDYEIWDYVPALITLDPYTELGVEVQRSSEADFSALYFAWLDEATYADYGAHEEDLVDYVLANSYGNSPSEIKGWPLYLTEEVSPATTRHFVAFIVDAEGKYGEVAHAELTSKELVKADFTWVEPYTSNVVDNVLLNTTTLKFTPVFEGGVEAASYKYVLVQTQYYNQYEGLDDAQMAEELFFSESSEVKTVSAEELLNGVLYVDGHSYGKPYYFAIVPIDAEGRPGASAAILEYEAVFALDEVVTEGEAFTATEPTIKINLPTDDEFVPDGGSLDGAYYTYQDQTEWGYGYYCTVELYYEITPVEGTEVAAVIFDATLYAPGTTVEAKAGQVWAESLGFSHVFTTQYFETSLKQCNWYQGKEVPAHYIYVSWKDAEGTVYFKEYDITPDLKKYDEKIASMIGGGILNETVLWEGEALADDWIDQPTLLTDAGPELAAVEAKAGQVLNFYAEPLEDAWQLQIIEGHWGPTYLSICSGGNDNNGVFTEYDLAGNDGKISLTLTQEILDAAFTQRLWGGVFLLSGDNIKLTKLTIVQ